MKKTFVLILSMLLISIGLATPITLKTAKNAAIAYFKIYGHQSNPEVNLAYTHYSDANVPVFYVYNLEPAGFVMIAGDDAVQPILASSLDNHFVNTNMPANIMWWLNNYKKQIQYVIDNQLTAPNDITDQWLKLLALQMVRSGSTRAVSPLCATTWDQSGYGCILYNNNSPIVSGERTPTGCVATAMAQIMKYWNHPASGEGSHSYNLDGVGTLSANFGNTSYNWNAMPNTLTCSSSSAQKTAVATLMYHCGIAVEMEFAPEGSGAFTSSFGGYFNYCSEYAFKDFFRYKPTITSLYRDYKYGFNNGYYQNNDPGYTQAEWIAALKAELDANRPILYSGSGDGGGHAFVCDGYNNSNQFHFNWGWGGTNDGYYTVNNLVPGSGGVGGGSYSFNEDQKVVIGIEPLVETAPTADFTPSTSYPGVGQQVQFVDNSTGNPTSWYWTFEGGTPSSSTAQNPVVTYYSTGTYSVTLTVSNAYGSNTTSQYITVDACSVGDGNVVGDITVYTLSNGGYVTGTNSYYHEFAEFFPDQEGILEQAYFYFYDVQQVSEGVEVNFTVYQGTDANSEPGMALATGTITLDEIAYDEANNNYTVVTFNPPINVTSQPFFIAVDLPTGAYGDTLTIVSAEMNSSTQNTTWVRYNNQWTSFPNLFESEPNMNLVVYPVVCNYPVEADFEALNTTVIVGSATMFTDLSTGYPTNWHWTFDGGTPSTATDQNPVVRYNTPGTYTVTLTASNNTSTDNETKIAYITVVDNTEPPIAVTATENTICAGESTTLSYQGGNGGHFAWYANACGGTPIDFGNNVIVTPSQTTTYYGRWESSYNNSPCLSVTVNVSEAPTATLSVNNPTLCAGESATLNTISPTNSNYTYIWNTGETTENITVTPDATTLYSVTVGNGTRCNTILSETITINETYTIDFSATACNSYTWNGITYNTSGDYTQTLATINGCDSVVTLHLTITDRITESLTETACNSYVWNGVTYTQSGTYTQTLTSIGGCDSVITLHLTISEVTTNAFSATACGSYTWNGATYTTSGDYTQTFTAANGCDSVVTLHLTINQIATFALSATACGSYTWNGATFTTSGDYTQTFTAANGCDSVATLHLTINTLPEIEIVQNGATLTATAGMATYQWNTGETSASITISTIGTYSVTVTNSNGCENTATIEVSNIPNTSIEEIVVSSIAIYPNPNYGQFTIMLNGIEKAIRYQVIDAKGALVQEAPINSNQTAVSIKAATGNYMVRVITENSVFVEKVIVK